MRPRISPAFFLLAAAVPAVSLSAQATPAGWPAVITYPSPTSGQSSIRLDRGSPLTISESPECQFNRIRAIVLHANGQLVVANAGNAELCVFGPGGRFIRRIGRRGTGPGEYQSIFGLYRLPGDSLLVYDAGLRRVSILDEEGQFARSIALIPPSDTLGSVVLVTSLADGSFLVGYSEFLTGPPRPEPVTFTQRVFRYDSRGKLLTSVGRFPASEHFIQAVPPGMGGVAYWNRTFGRLWSVVALPNGFAAGDGTDFSVAQYAPDGSRALLHRLDRRPRSVTAEHIAAYRRQSLTNLRAENRAVEERRLADMPYPSTFPAFRRLMSDAVGRLWLELFPAPPRSSDPPSVSPRRPRPLSAIRRHRDHGLRSGTGPR